MIFQFSFSFRGENISRNRRSVRISVCSVLKGNQSFFFIYLFMYYFFFYELRLFYGYHNLKLIVNNKFYVYNYEHINATSKKKPVDKFFKKMLDNGIGLK